MHKARYNLFKLDFKLSPRSPVRVGAGGESPNPALPDLRFVRTFLAGKGEVIFVPGSSLKGVFRSFAERVLTAAKGEGKNGACNLSADDSCGKRLEEEEERLQKILEPPELYRESCNACKLFGNTKLKGRLTMLDAYPEGEIRTEVRHGVAISRLTQAVSVGPYDIEVIIGGTFGARLLVENFEAWQLGLISLALRNMNEGFLKVGFGKSRGFGEMNAEVTDFEVLSARRYPQTEIWGIGKFLPKEEFERYGIRVSDGFVLSITPKEEMIDGLQVRRAYSKEAWPDFSQSAIAHLREVFT